MKPVIAVIIVVLSVCLFIGTYLLNKKMGKPKIKIEDLPEKCMTCPIETCQAKKQIKEFEKEGEECERSELH